MRESPSYDLFISYADADAAWVNGYLLDALTQADIRVHTEATFALGAPRLLEFERAIQQSQRTLLIISQAYLSNNVAQFTDLLAQTYDVQTMRWHVIPLLRDAGLPLTPRLAMLIPLPATTPEEWEEAILRLCAELRQPPPRPSAKPPCPYPGMLPFQANTMRFFYGRDHEITDLLQRLRHHRMLYVIGPSGSGKSSLVLAGLLPQLSAGRSFPEGHFVVQRMRPGQHPNEALAQLIGANRPPVQAIAKLLNATASAERLLLVIDQFEELFTLASREDQQSFIATLKALAESNICTLLIAMRADFYPRAIASKSKTDIVCSKQRFLIGMSWFNGTKTKKDGNSIAHSC